MRCVLGLEFFRYCSSFQTLISLRCFLESLFLILRVPFRLPRLFSCSRRATASQSFPQLLLQFGAIPLLSIAIDVLAALLYVCRIHHGACSVVGHFVRVGVKHPSRCPAVLVDDCTMWMWVGPRSTTTVTRLTLT